MEIKNDYATELIDQQDRLTVNHAPRASVYQVDYSTPVVPFGYLAEPHEEPEEELPLGTNDPSHVPRRTRHEWDAWLNQNDPNYVPRRAIQPRNAGN
jgi:hypothetical protein